MVPLRASRDRSRGAFRDRHERWGMGRDGRDDDARRAAAERTAKSCGLGASTLASTRGNAVAMSALRARHAGIVRGWWQQSPITKESTKETVKTVAQGRP